MKRESSCSASDVYSVNAFDSPENSFLFCLRLPEKQLAVVITWIKCMCKPRRSRHQHDSMFVCGFSPCHVKRVPCYKGFRRLVELPPVAVVKDVDFVVRCQYEMGPKCPLERVNGLSLRTSVAAINVVDLVSFDDGVPVGLSLISAFLKTLGRGLNPTSVKAATFYLAHRRCW